MGLKIEFKQSNVEGEIVNFIQDARKKYNGIIINASGNVFNGRNFNDYSCG